MNPTSHRALEGRVVRSLRATSHRQSPRDAGRMGAIDKRCPRDKGVGSADAARKRPSGGQDIAGGDVIGERFPGPNQETDVTRTPPEGLYIHWYFRLGTEPVNGRQHSLRPPSRIARLTVHMPDYSCEYIS